MVQPLMPKATAVWLIDNTSLTFQQIAAFCGLHELEVKGIADGDVATGIKGMDPITAGQLRRDDLEKAEADPGHHMALAQKREDVPTPERRKGPRYTPVSRRQDRPDAIAWLVRNHPELSDAQISKLVGTTKPTITAIRDRSHWNSANIKPVDPVTLGLSSQIELDEAVIKAAAKAERAAKKAAKGAPLKPTTESLKESAPEEEVQPEPEIQKIAANPFAESLSQMKERKEEEEVLDADAIFANLNKKPEEDQE